MNSIISTGTSVIDSNAAPAIANVLVNASGANNRPSCASSVTPAGTRRDDQQREKQSGADFLHAAMIALARMMFPHHLNRCVGAGHAAINQNVAGMAALQDYVFNDSP